MDVARRPFRSYLALFILLLSTFSGTAQKSAEKLPFAFPNHTGAMSLDQGDWKITEFSAKANGSELGIRAHRGPNELLGFLYPAFKGKGNAQTCRESMLQTEKLDRSDDVSQRDLMKSDSGVEIATVLIAIPDRTKLAEHIPGTPLLHTKSHANFRAFIGSSDICGDISFFFDLSSSDQQRAAIASFQDELRTLQFDPKTKPTFLGAFTYATVELTHVGSGEFNRYLSQNAFENYQIALDRVNTSDDPAKWRPIAIDQRSIAFSLMQGIDGFRSALRSVVAHSPDNYGPYYLLSNVDALDKDADAARVHLQQAFDRRANSLPGDVFPDPANNEALQTLREDKAFWAFVEGISAKIKN